MPEEVQSRRLDYARKRGDHHDRAAWYAEVVKEWSAAQKSLILGER
jgi:hypothetical protein